jgi:hypothetical protein
MRVRSKEDVASSKTAEVYHSRRGIVDSFPWLSVNYTPDSDITYTEDVVIPNFKRRVAAGEVFNNPYSRTTTVVQRVAGDWTEDSAEPSEIPYVHFGEDEVFKCPQLVEVGSLYAGRMESGLSSGHLGNIDIDIDISSLKDIAINQAFASVDASEASALVSIAELEKTVAFVKSTLYTAVKFVRDAKKGRLRKISRGETVESLSDFYMGLRYGLRPLVIDCEQVVKAFNASRTTGLRKTARGFATGSDAGSETWFDDLSYTNTYGDKVNKHHTVTRDVERNVNVRASVLYELTPISLPDLKVWGFHDILGAAWELIPFSFIIGWFMNISDTLKAWQPKAGVNVLSACVTVHSNTIDSRKHKYVSERKTYYVLGDDKKEYSFSGTGGYESSYFSVTDAKSRSIVTGPTTPSVDINLDFFKLADLTIIFDKVINGTLKDRKLRT